jgi:hypothetical protein
MPSVRQTAGGGAVLISSAAASHSCQFFVVSLLFVSVLTPPQGGAKALFDAGSTRSVGVHYWFEDGRGRKLADPSGAGVGSKVVLHVRSNVAAYLTVWMSDASHDSVELTSRTSPGPGDVPPAVEIQRRLS